MVSQTGQCTLPLCAGVDMYGVFWGVASKSGDPNQAQIHQSLSDVVLMSLTHAASAHLLIEAAFGMVPVEVGSAFALALDSFGQAAGFLL